MPRSCQSRLHNSMDTACQWRARHARARSTGHVRAMMQALELDLDDANLTGTPERIAHLYTELFAAVGGQPVAGLSSFPNAEQYTGIVAVTDIPFYSLCAHHFLPFFGRAHVAYVPGERIVGLGELARVVDLLARRPQLQEQLSEQVVGCLERELRPAGAIVVLQARHLCMEMRGMQKSGALATTSAIRGVFEDRGLRDEFLRLIPAGARI